MNGLSIESTSNISTITSDELPYFEPNPFPTPFSKRNHQHLSFPGKSNYSCSLFFQSDTLPQDMYYSNNAYGCANRMTSYPYRRCSCDSDCSSGLYTSTYDSDDYYDYYHSCMNYSPELNPSYSYYSMEGECIKEGLSDSYYKSFPVHYSLWEKYSPSLYPYHFEEVQHPSHHPFNSVPIRNSISLKMDDPTSISSSPPQVYHSYYDITPPVKDDNLTSEVVCSTTMKKDSNQQDAVETMNFHSSLPSQVKSHHKGPIKKQLQPSSNEAPGNPDDIDPVNELLESDSIDNQSTCVFRKETKEKHGLLPLCY